MDSTPTSAAAGLAPLPYSGTNSVGIQHIENGYVLNWYGYGANGGNHALHCPDLDAVKEQLQQIFNK